MSRTYTYAWSVYQFGALLVDAIELFVFSYYYYIILIDRAIDLVMFSSLSLGMSCLSAYLYVAIINLILIYGQSQQQQRYNKLFRTKCIFFVMVG